MDRMLKITTRVTGLAMIAGIGAGFSIIYNGSEWLQGSLLGLFALLMGFSYIMALVK